MLNKESSVCNVPDCNLSTTGKCKIVEEARSNFLDPKHSFTALGLSLSKKDYEKDILEQECVRSKESINELYEIKPFKIVDHKTKIENEERVA